MSAGRAIPPDGLNAPDGAIPPAAWATIEQTGTRMRFAPGEALLHHGATGRHWFAVVSGTVLVTVTSTQGSTLVLSRSTAGELVGELAALEGAPRAATVSAKDDVVALKLRADDLDALLRSHPDWAISMLRSLAGQLRSMSYRYALRSEDLRRRVEALLLTHLEETGESVVRSTREELAAWVGATREATARVLKLMDEDGAVLLTRGAVEILDPSRMHS